MKWAFAASRSDAALMLRSFSFVKTTADGVRLACLWHGWSDLPAESQTPAKTGLAGGRRRKADGRPDRLRGASAVALRAMA